MMNKKIFASASILSGTMIGAGILGMPYTFGKSGFLIGAFWLIILGVIIIFTDLCLGEITLRTKSKHQLVGYAKKYLGKTGEKIMFFAVTFGVYAALVAFLIGEGESLSQILPWNLNPILYAFLFWIMLTILLEGKIKELKKIETYDVLLIIILIAVLLAFSLNKINAENLLAINPQNFFVPIGVILFSLLGFVAIPEIRNVLSGNEKLMKKTIIFGAVIPIILYFIFCMIFVGIVGKNIPEVATLSFGDPAIIVGIFTMLSAYLIISFSLKNTYKYDFKLPPTAVFFLSSVLPLAFYLTIEGLKIASFEKILGIGGVISGGLTGIMILVINYQSKKIGERKPEIKMPLGLITIIILSLIFISGIILEFLY